MDQAQTPTWKPTMPIHVELERVSDNLLQFYLTQMLGLLSPPGPKDGNLLYSFLKLLDVANLLDTAMDSINWAELPFDIVLQCGCELTDAEASC